MVSIKRTICLLHQIILNDVAPALSDVWLQKRIKCTGGYSLINREIEPSCHRLVRLFFKAHFTYFVEEEHKETHYFIREKDDVSQDLRNKPNSFKGNSAKRRRTKTKKHTDRVLS